MSPKFDVPNLIRVASFFLVFSIPSLYLPGFYPFFALPVSVTAFSCMGYAASSFRAFRISMIPRLLLSILAVIAFYGTLLAVSSAIHRPSADIFHLRLARSIVIFTVSGAFATASSMLHSRSPRWRRIEPLILMFSVVFLFWSQGNHALTILDHPAKAALLACAFMASQLFALAILSKRTIKCLLPFACFLPVAGFLAVAVVGSYNANAVANDGGLIQPTMFRFDFSPYLSLKDEIRTNDRLVMIVKTKEEYAGNFLRRVYLSGWDPEKGFYECIAPDESPQSTRVPSGRQNINAFRTKGRRPAEQEFFVVNFDPTSLVAMDYPVSVTRYELWNQSSFSGAYAVTSEVPAFIPLELRDIPGPAEYRAGEPGSPEDGTLSAKTLAFYTAIDRKTAERLRPLAERITAGIPGYYDRILALNEFLHDGEYRYSLRPGIAEDGDRIGSFLFRAKKGYCTYFAFSLCLMLRSVGIPSRVAAGFFLQGNSSALDYYPVRSNMAHAWVEVFFPEYGWIAFDPTTQKLAEGEALDPSGSAGGDDFMNLLGEILDNGTRLDAPRAVSDTNDNLPSPLRAFHALLAFIAAAFSTHPAPALVPCALLAVFALLAITHRHRRNGEPRRAILEKYERMSRKFRLARGTSTPSETRARVLSLRDDDAETLYALAQKAKFAGSCDAEDALRASRAWDSLKHRHALPRQMLSRIRFAILRFPFRRLVVALALLALFAIQSRLVADPATDAFATTDPAATLLSRAKTAVLSENWENAVLILSEGIRRYPEDSSFHVLLGNVYYGQKLYEPAYGEFSRAQKLGSDDVTLYSSLADTLSCLNRDAEAIEYLSAYLAKKDDDLFAWSNYGWLCYKTHRLETGITALLRVIDRFGPDGNIFVGLGNLYTAAFMYPEAKKYYTLAIGIAEELGQNYLASIYYYNRSILEKTFFKFDEAYRDTLSSIARAPRSSGYLMQSELELRKLEFAKATALYAKALSLDSTPLAAIGLADTCIQTGDADRAFAYISSLKRKTDRSWIANYGTTIHQYEADYHMLERDYYRLIRNREKRTVIHGLSTRISSWARQIRWSASLWYHETLYRIKNTDIAKHYARVKGSPIFATEQNLYINSYYFLAFDAWRSTAEPYLEKSRDIEIGVIPELYASYQYERGALTNDVLLLDEAIQTLNPVWEREILVKALARRLSLTPARDKLVTANYDARLYDANPAAFIFYDIPFSVQMPESTPKWVRTLLRHAGFINNEKSAYELVVQSTTAGLSLALVDRNRNNTVYAQDLNNLRPSLAEKASFINKFSTEVFTMKQ